MVVAVLSAKKGLRRGPYPFRVDFGLERQLHVAVIIHDRSKLRPAGNLVVSRSASRLISLRRSSVVAIGGSSPLHHAQVAHVQVDVLATVVANVGGRGGGNHQLVAGNQDLAQLGGAVAPNGNGSLHVLAVILVLVVSTIDTGVSLQGGQRQGNGCGDNLPSGRGRANVAHIGNLAGQQAQMLSPLLTLTLEGIDHGRNPATQPISLSVLVLRLVDGVNVDGHFHDVLAGGLLLVGVLHRASTEDDLGILLDILQALCVCPEDAQTDEGMLSVNVGIVLLLLLSVLSQQRPGVSAHKHGEVQNGGLTLLRLAVRTHVGNDAFNQESVGDLVAVLVHGNAGVHRQVALSVLVIVISHVSKSPLNVKIF